MKRTASLGLLLVVTMAALLAIPARPARASTVVATITDIPGDEYAHIAVDLNINRILAVGSNGNFVSIDGDTNVATSHVPTIVGPFYYPFEYPTGIALNPAGSILYQAPFADINTAALQLDLGTWNATSLFIHHSLATDFAGAAFNPNDNRLYLTGIGNCTGGILEWFDATNPLPAGFTSYGVSAAFNSPSGIAINRVTNRIYLRTVEASYGCGVADVDHVVVLDGNGLEANVAPTILAQVSVAPEPIESNHTPDMFPAPIAVNENTNRIYTTTQDAGTTGVDPGYVTVIDGNTNQVIGDPIEVGVLPMAIAVSPNGRIYVANWEGSVSVIDGDTNQVVETIPVGPDAEAIGISNKYVYVSCAGAGADAPPAYPRTPSIYVIDPGGTPASVQNPDGGPQPVELAPSPTTTLTFSQVTTTGETTIQPISGSPTPPAGTQFVLPPPPNSTSSAVYPTYFDISTTVPPSDLAKGVDVTVAYDPTIFYDPSTNPNGPQPVLIHYVQSPPGSGNYVVDTNAQSTFDSTKHTVTVHVTSFSPFAVFGKPLDTAPPTITLRNGAGTAIASGATIGATATSAAGAAVSFSASAADDIDGPVPVQYSAAPGSTFAPGVTPVTVTARDSSGNGTSASLNVAVSYSWSGILSPVNVDGSSVFKLGSTIPVKFQLTGASAGIANLQAKLYVAQADSVDPVAVNEAVSTAAADVGNTFRYDATAHQYVFNLSSKGLSKGTWYMRIDLGDGTSNVVAFKLK